MRTFTEEEVEILLNSRICEKPKTNADRIRSFSDEELAQFLIKTDCCLAKSEHVDCSNQEECGVCEEMIRSWLQSEVEI